MLPLIPTMSGDQLLLEPRQLRLQATDLLREAGDDALRELRHVRRAALDHPPRQLECVMQASGSSHREAHAVAKISVSAQRHSFV